MTKKQTENMLKKIDAKGFASDLEKLRKEISASLSIKDFKHLRKIELWGRLCTLLGYATAWIFPNPISAFLISQGNATRWGIMEHHISHGGYDNVPGVPKRYTSKKFARGWRRFIDWFDWIYPNAWMYEHNILHHYNTGDEKDPDTPEYYVKLVDNLPKWLGNSIIIILMFTWKFVYYAPNTLYTYKTKKSKVLLNKKNLLNFWFNKDVWTKSYIPYFLFKFILLPLLFFPLGIQAIIFVLINIIFAELLTNFHTFMMIVPNHTGPDLYRFSTKVSDKKDFYVRQILSSTNMKIGSDFNDFLHLFLNYQVEHHLFPNIPLLQYKKIQPKLKKLCKKHNIPYTQESVWIRFKKLLKVIVYRTEMKQIKSSYQY